MAKKKKKKRKKNTNPNITRLKLINNSAKLHGSWINQDWKTSGYAYIIIARKMQTGLLMFSVFWIDTSKNIIEECFADVSITEENFNRYILKKEENIELFNIDIQLLKEIIAQALVNMEKNGKSLPKLYTQSIKIIGTIKEEISRIKNNESGENSDLNTDEKKDIPRLEYKVNNPDFETVEAQVRQIPGLEEADESKVGYRCFNWTAQKRQGFFKSKKIDIFLGKLILKQEILILELDEKKNAEYAENLLLQYLGTAITYK